MLGLVTDATLTGPRAGTMGEAGEAALWELAAAIATLQFLLQWFGPTLEHRICGNANNLGNAKELAELVEQRQSETSIAAQLDGHAGKRGFQRGTKLSNMGTIRA